MFSRRPDRPREEPRFPTSAPSPAKRTPAARATCIAVPAGGPTSPWGRLADARRVRPRERRGGER